MTPAARLALLALAAVALGCEDVSTHTTRVAETPPKVLEPKAPDEVAPTKAEDATARPAEPVEHAATDPDVQLVPVKYDAMMARIAADKTARLTMVDAWATWCGPCKENFPHVVAMNEKYGPQGLRVISLSLDDPEETKQVEEARKFLRQQKATFTNFLLDEAQGDAFDKLNVNSIPAVFLFGPDGKEVKRFTIDDPDHQFTYDEVEREVADRLKSGG